MNQIPIYTNEIKKYPLLSEKEENELIKAYQEGNDSALSKFIHHNLRLVFWVIKRNCSFVQPQYFDEAIALGNIGLIKAAKKFDPSKGRFATYAPNWIKQVIYQKFSELTNTIRVPPSRLKKLLKASEDELSEQDREILKTFTQMSSIDEEILDDSSRTRHNFISSDEEIESLSDRYYLKQLAKSALKENEYLVIKYRYSDGFTLEEAGTLLKVSRERVRQIEQKALKKLRAEIENEKLKQKYFEINYLVKGSEMPINKRVCKYEGCDTKFIPEHGRQVYCPEHKVGAGGTHVVPVKEERTCICDLTGCDHIFTTTSKLIKFCIDHRDPQVRKDFTRELNGIPKRKYKRREKKEILSLLPIQEEKIDNTVKHVDKEPVFTIIPAPSHTSLEKKENIEELENQFMDASDDEIFKDRGEVKDRSIPKPSSDRNKQTHHLRGVMIATATNIMMDFDWPHRDAKLLIIRDGKLKITIEEDNR